MGKRRTAWQTLAIALCNMHLTCDVAQSLVFAAGRKLRGRKGPRRAYTDDM